MDTSTLSINDNSKISNFERLKLDYSQNISEKLQDVGKIINQINPINYRLEILENIYSMIYLSVNDLKETEDEEDDNDENLNDEDDVDYYQTNANSTVNYDSEDNQAKNQSQIQQNQISLNSDINDNSGFEILNDLVLSTNANNRNSLKTNDETEFSIYEPSGASQRPNALINATNMSSKSTIGSCYSYGSSDGRRYYRHSSGNGASGEGGDNGMNRKEKLSIYCSNAGGGGLFLVNDFLCRDILLLLSDSLKSCTSTTKDMRFSKLQQLVSETLWRFQIVKPDLVSMDFGQVAILSTDPKSLISANDKQKVIVYELLKKHKANHSSAGSTASLMLESYKQEMPGFSRQKSHQGSTDENKRNTSNKNRANTYLSGGTYTTCLSTLLNKEHRRSVESHRSLSLIYPSHRPKSTNQTIMKLLSSVESLSSLCLKENRIAEANQLVKMYSSKKPSDSFEFRQLVFNSIYEKTIDDLKKLNLKQRLSNDSLVEQTLQTLDLTKITEDLLSFEKDNFLLQCIYLVDTLLVSNVNLNYISNIVDFAIMKLNQNFNKKKSVQNDSDTDTEVN